jgi:putative transcriptional regulator
VSEQLRGRLLVATPELRPDPNFARTVVLVLEHGDEGALGVVLNRATDATIADSLPAWTQLSAAPGVLFVGGPVQPDSAIGIGRRAESAGESGNEPGDGVGEGEGDEPEGFAPLFDGLGTVDLERDPLFVVPAVDLVRVFVGYAGWGAGQLEGELAAEGWFVVEAQPDDVFCTQPDSLWRKVLRRQRGDLRMFADYPVDPASN